MINEPYSLDTNHLPHPADRNTIVRSCTRLIQQRAIIARRTNPGVDVSEAAGIALERLVHAMAKPTFPWEVADAHAAKLWKSALDEQRALRGHTHLSPSHDVVERVNRARQSAQHAGDALTVENVHRHGIGTGPRKTAPGRDIIRHILSGTVELDAPRTAADDERARYELPADASGRYIEAGEEVVYTVPFMPTETTRADLERLVEARSHDPEDSAGVDCSRLDILALLRFEQKVYSNRTLTAAYPTREQRRILGVNNARLAELHATLDLAIDTARAEATARKDERARYLAHRDAEWKRAMSMS